MLLFKDFATKYSGLNPATNLAWSVGEITADSQMPRDLVGEWTQIIAATRASIFDIFRRPATVDEMTAAYNAAHPGQHPIIVAGTWTYAPDTVALYPGEKKAGDATVAELAASLAAALMDLIPNLKK